MTVNSYRERINTRLSICSHAQGSGWLSTAGACLRLPCSHGGPTSQPFSHSRGALVVGRGPAKPLPAVRYLCSTPQREMWKWDSEKNRYYIITSTQHLFRNQLEHQPPTSRPDSIWTSSQLRSLHFNNIVFFHCGATTYHHFDLQTSRSGHRPLVTSSLVRLHTYHPVGCDAT